MLIKGHRDGILRVQGEEQRRIERHRKGNMGKPLLPHVTHADHRPPLKVVAVSICDFHAAPAASCEEIRSGIKVACEVGRLHVIPDKERTA